MSEARFGIKDAYAAVGIASLAVGSRALYNCVSYKDGGQDISIAKTTAGFLTGILVSAYSYSQIMRKNDETYWTLDRIGPYYPKPGDPKEAEYAALQATVTDITPEVQTGQLAA